MPPDARSRYLANTILTASPARLVTLLYDGLVSDLHGAAAAFDTGDFETANTRLMRAQGIVLELQGSLRTDIWDGADRLLAIYRYVYKRLVEANIFRNRGACAECLALVTPLQAAWHEAAKVTAESLTAASA